MRTWTRAKWTRHCGRCGELLEVGAPMLEYTMPTAAGRSLTLIRCGPCEGGAPPDLPLETIEGPAPLPPDTWARLGLLPMNYAPARNREPGEEG